MATPRAEPVRDFASEAPEKAFGWRMIAVVLLLAAAAAAIALWLTQTEGDTPVLPGDDHVTPTAEPVEVRVRTDIDGELYVDGERRGRLHEGEETRLELGPGGPYRFEARVDDDTIASQSVTVAEGRAVMVDLFYPVVAEDDAGPPDAATAAPDAGGVVPTPPAGRDAGPRVGRDAGVRPGRDAGVRDAGVRAARDAGPRVRRDAGGRRPPPGMDEPDPIQHNPFDG